MGRDDACDYIIVKTTEGGARLSLLKLQKLMYYAQAWHLTFFGRPLFEGTFQAWVHGPVSRDLYDRFSATKGLYDDVTLSDIRPAFMGVVLDAQEQLHIDTVLEVYAKFSGTQLEELTHREEPWLLTRGNLHPSQRSEAVIPHDLMKSYYSRQLA